MYYGKPTRNKSYREPVVNGKWLATDGKPCHFVTQIHIIWCVIKGTNFNRFKGID